MDYKDYYKIMGVEKDASQDEIKRAYRKLARKYHPDVSKESDAELRFKEVGEAYEALKDPEKRAAYDQLGSNWKAGQDFNPPPDWNAGFEFSGGGYTGADDADYSDFFESLFGRGFGSSQAHHRTGRTDGYSLRGEDHHAKVIIDLEDAYQGATRAVTLQSPVVDNSGHVTTKQRTLNIKIPKGVKQGQRIRLNGQGSPGMGQAPAGDLYLEIEFKQHHIYRVDGHDVYIDLPVAPWEAALGATVKVPTPDGVVDLKIAAGTKTGQKLRLKARGIPGKPPGDLYVIPSITLPSADSDAAKELYRKMEQEMAYNPRSKLGV
ncbi:MAG: DnaJ domain-containing protein [Gammaproteobacteria bacterium]|nr:DnaJ domain-containing protein [Gammaproteobacteria bacterium]MCW8986571.1 DnaJ domain-containing protein [Gammaproteobacteria bacterium]MCW9031980.1 DnaJ domain-containing protein [Gammaproteobacteria bacterium]